MIVFIIVVDVDACEQLRSLYLVFVKCLLEILETPDQLLTLIPCGWVHATLLITILIELSVNDIFIGYGDITGCFLEVHRTYIAERCI